MKIPIDVVYELNHPEEFSFWFTHDFDEEPKHGCKICEADTDDLYNGVCADCLAKLYDTYEVHIKGYFDKFSPDIWVKPEDRPGTYEQIWQTAEIERKRKIFGLCRKWFKEYALEDLGSFADYLKEEGII